MGRLRVIRGVPSPPEGIERTVRVYTPDAYEREPGARFGVVYFQDGQNVFDPPAGDAYPAWGANGALDALARAGAIEPWMAVGVDHRGVDRLGDYAPWPDARSGVARAGADAYVRFLADHLAPSIDRAYRTRPDRAHRAVVGSSMGGLLALHAARTRPDAFARAGALSPSVMWADGATLDAWTERLDARVYLDAGDREWFDAGGWRLDYGGWTAAMYWRLRALGYRSDALRLVLEKGAGHDEGAWRRRLPWALGWLLGA